MRSDYQLTWTWSEQIARAFDRMSTVTAPADVVDSTASALENQFGLADRIVGENALANSAERFRQQGITLQTFAQLENPASFDHATKVAAASCTEPTPATGLACTGTTTSPGAG